MCYVQALQKVTHTATLLVQGLQKMVFKTHTTVLPIQVLQKVVFKTHTATLLVRALQYFVLLEDKYPLKRKKSLHQI